jgi:WD40 repeat protein
MPSPVEQRRQRPAKSNLSALKVRRHRKPSPPRHPPVHDQKSVTPFRRCSSYAQFSPDSQRVVTACQDGTARAWDSATGAPIGEPMKHGSNVSCAQFSPDGQRVVTASWDKTVRVWDSATGKAISGPMKHGKPVLSARFSLDGGQIVTASADGTASCGLFRRRATMIQRRM